MNIYVIDSVRRVGGDHSATDVPVVAWEDICQQKAKFIFVHYETGRTPRSRWDSRAAKRCYVVRDRQWWLWGRYGSLDAAVRAAKKLAQELSA